MLKRETKICLSCGRYFAYQKRWRKTWSEVRYCSKRCRREKLNKSDLALETAILSLLEQGEKGETISPLDAAKLLMPNNEEVLKERMCRASRRLAAADKIDILQNNLVLDPSKAKGEIRLRLR